MSILPITERSQRCLRALEGLARRPDDRQPFDGIEESLEDSLGRLKVWTASYGLDDPEAATSLESRLEVEPELAASFVKLLADLEDELSRVERILETPSLNRVELGNPSDTEPCSEVLELTKLVGETISELFSLSALARTVHVGQRPRLSDEDLPSRPVTLSTEVAQPLPPETYHNRSIADASVRTRRNLFHTKNLKKRDADLSRAWPTPEIRQSSSRSASTACEEEHDSAWSKQVIDLARSSRVYAGECLDDLAKYLARPVRKSHRPAYAAQPSAYAVLHGFAEHSSVTEFTSPDELQCFQAANAANAVGTEHGQLLFLRGHPSPAWINAVGGVFNVNPDFLSRHLKDYLRSSDDQELYTLPQLPSMEVRDAYLQISTIGLHSFDRSSHRSRKYMTDQLQQYITHNLYDQAVVGSSLIRGISVYDDKYLSIDQGISIWTRHNEQGWFALVFFDHGVDGLENGPLGNLLRGLLSNTRLLPTPFVRLSRPSNEDLGQRQYAPDQACSTVRQHTKHLSQGYVRNLDPVIARLDCFYALSALFSYAAASEKQLSNLLASKIEKEIQEDYSENLTGFSISNLLCLRSTLSAQVERLQESICFLEQTRQWPTALAHGSDHLDKVDKLRSSLLEDYEHLLAYSKVSTSKCKSAFDIVMQLHSLTESRTVIVQAKRVQQLTFLAFIFLPLSFTASFFGMNVEQFGTGTLPLWTWFAVTVPILIAVVLLVGLDGHIIEKLRNWIRGISRRVQGGRSHGRYDQC